MKINKPTTVITMIYIEDLKRFINKWRYIFKTIGYENVSVSIANAQTGLENELESIGQL